MNMIVSTNSLIRIITEGKVTINNVSCHKIIHSHINVFPVKDIDFVKDLIMLQTNLFEETLNWEYEKVDNSVLGEFIIFCNCRKTDYGTAYIAHLRVNDGVNADEVEKILSIKNESEE